MPRKLTPRSSLESLRREAKRWLKALRANDPAARARLERALPNAAAAPTLRDVQLALAREYGFAGWAALKDAVAGLRASAGDAAGDTSLGELLAAAARGDAARVAALLDRLIGLRVPALERVDRRALEHLAVDIEAGAVARAVP